MEILRSSVDKEKTLLVMLPIRTAVGAETPGVPMLLMKQLASKSILLNQRLFSKANTDDLSRVTSTQVDPKADEQILSSLDRVSRALQLFDVFFL
jgi:hypothetical protein